MVTKLVELKKASVKSPRQPVVTPLLVVSCLIFTGVCLFAALLTYPQHEELDQFSASTDADYGQVTLLDDIEEESSFCSNSDRVERVRMICEKYDWSSKPHERRSHFYRKILSDDVHQLLYCVVPELLSISVKSLLARASGKMKEGTPARVNKEWYLKSVGLRYLDEYDTKDIQYKLNNYYKFMVVMDPLKRLNATYHPWDFPKKHHSKAIKRLFSEMHRSARGSRTIKFGQFLQLISRGTVQDTHWAPLFDLCHPCDIMYDQILKVESFERDLGPILENLWPSTENRSRAVAKSINYAELNRVRSATINLHPLDIKTVSNVLQRYQKDMDLFGYKWSYLYGSSCQNGNVRNLTCC